METLHSFPPVVRANARLLILGSMPGRKSLDEQEYYAHPRNAFWKIMGQLLQFDSGADYDRRIASLMDSGVALWDVMAACSRSSSLDSDIVESSIIANDFNTFFSRYREIKAVYFNGLKAWHSYHKHVRPGLDSQWTHTSFSLPSTSPANARMTFEEKLDAWSKPMAFVGIEHFPEQDQ